MHIIEHQTRIDKVIELHLRKFTQVQISKDMNISTRDVNKIINDYKEKMYGFSGKSFTARAFEMYSEGYSPVDVVKELDIPPEDAEKFYSDYLRLEDRQIVNLFYDEMKDKMPEFSDTCKIIRKYNDDNNMNIRFIKIRDLDHIISKMERKKEQTEMENRDAEKYKLRLGQEIRSMETQMELARKRITNQW